MEWTEKHEACLKQLTMIVATGSSVQDAKNSLVVMGLDAVVLDQVESRYFEILREVLKKDEDGVLEPSNIGPLVFRTSGPGQVLAEVAG